MRPDWDEYFMKVAKLVATRSTCLRRQVGAVAVREKRILATGYNGAPIGLKHCEELGCLRKRLGIPSGERQELCRAVHAEQNVIIQAAKLGISLDNATLYITHFPCYTCAKLLINAGIKRIVYEEDYPDEFAKKILEEAKITIEKLQLPNDK